MTILRSLALLFSSQSGALSNLLCVQVKLEFIWLRAHLAYVVFGLV